MDGYSIPSIVCDIYFHGTYPCFGGVLALDGTTGKELWRHYAAHEIYGLNCNADLDKDGVLDCLAGGRAGVRNGIVIDPFIDSSPFNPLPEEKNLGVFKLKVFVDDKGSFTR